MPKQGKAEKMVFHSMPKQGKQKIIFWIINIGKAENGFDPIPKQGKQKTLFHVDYDPKYLFEWYKNIQRAGLRPYVACKFILLRRVRELRPFRKKI